MFIFVDWKTAMTREEHKARHELLHKHFDELMADFIGDTGSLPSETNLLELMEWSYTQTQNPTSVEKAQNKAPLVLHKDWKKFYAIKSLERL